MRPVGAEGGQVMDFFLAAGAPMAFARQLPTYVALFSGGFAFLTRWFSPLCALVNTVAFVIRKARALLKRASAYSLKDLGAWE